MSELRSDETDRLKVRRNNVFLNRRLIATVLIAMTVISVGLYIWRRGEGAKSSDLKAPEILQVVPADLAIVPESQMKEFMVETVVKRTSRQNAKLLER